MVSRILIALFISILIFGSASAAELNGELVEAQASTAGATPPDCDIESGDCDDTDERREPSEALDDDSDGDSISDADGTRKFDMIDNAPEEKERGTEDSDDDGLSDGAEHAEPILAIDNDSDEDGYGDAIGAEGGPVHRDLAARNVERVRMLMNGSLQSIEKSDMRRGLLADVSNWSNETRSAVAEYVRRLTDVNGSDRGLAIAAFASGNEHVSLRYDETNEALELEHEERVRVLGVVPVPVNARTTVDTEGNIETRFPWWAIGPRKNVLERFA